MLLYIALDFTSAIIHLPNKTLLFHDSPGLRQKKFMNFQAWKMKFLNSISLRKQPSFRDARGGFPAK